MKIKTRIFLYFFLTGLLLVAVGIPVSNYLYSRTLREEIGNHLQTTVHSRANHINYFLEEQKDKIRFAAVSDDIRKGLKREGVEEGEALTKFLERLIASSREFYEIFLLDKEGYVFATTNPEEEMGEDFSQDSIFIKGKEEVFIKDVFFDEEYDKHGMAVSVPIYSDEREFIGVLVGRIELTALNEIVLNMAGLKETGEVHVINREGYLITPSRFREGVFLEEKADLAGVEHCFAEHPQKEHMQAREYNNYRGVKVLGSHHYISEMQWCTIAEIDENELFEPIQNVLAMSLIMGGVLLAVVFTVSRVVSNHISKPIEALHHGTERVEKGDFNFKVGTDAKDEIGQLSRSFDKMTKSLKDFRAGVEKKVEERTAELEKRTKELEKINKLMVGRELKMAEMKKEMGKSSKKDSNK